MPSSATMYENTNVNTTGTTKKTEANKRFESLKTEYQQYESSYMDLQTYLNPTRGRFNDDYSNKGKMIDHKKLLDAYATRSLRKTASGLNSGITSKARPWFRLLISQEELMQYPTVKMWLDDTQKRMYTVLEGSNIYGTFQNTYEELLTFATGCFILLPDYDSVIRTRNFTAGEYYLGTNNKGQVDSFCRRFRMTVGQLVMQFGRESCSQQVQAKWDTNHRDDEIWVRHLIEPNDLYNELFTDASHMPIRSCYWEEGDGSEDFLAIRGYKRFPVVAPRWSVPTTDLVYGYGPGWDALGDVKELQKLKYDKAMAREKMHNPPMQEDANVVGHSNTLPGGITKSSSNVPNTGVRPAYQINPNLESFIESENQCKQAIDGHFYADLFSLFAILDRGQMTATEVASREQERIMLMGPILNRLDEEMLSKVIELVFWIMLEGELLLPPPDELQGAEIKVQYISILAQAQRAVGSQKVEKIIATVGQTMALDPTIRDIINLEESIREIASVEGAPEKILNEDSVIQEIREERARVANIQAGAQMATSAADISKTLSETDLDKNSALNSATQGIRQGLSRAR